MALDSTYIRTDVTAVALYNDLVLVGIGSSLFVYSANSTIPIFRLICLDGQKIYGFKRRKLDECFFIVFGGKQFTVVLGSDRNKAEDGPIVFTRLFKPVVCDDWLHSVAWNSGDMGAISVLTAHNVVQNYNPITLALISQHRSKDNSILYSGLLLPLKQNMLVMAGTVYSEVILYICGENKPLHRLKGHKGVIFSISCLPQANIIVTTSDDRSVRIWGLNSTPHAPWNSTEYWRNQIVCKHELYGHLARVMRSRITDKEIVSVGEDSRICFWSHHGVRVDKILKRHQNAGIWSIDIHNQLLLTGGGDGAVTLQSYPVENHQQNDVISLIIGKPKQVSYSDAQNLFILTENNRFVYYNTQYRTESSSTLNDDFDTTFHALSVSPDRQMCAVAGRKSFIKIALEVGDPEEMMVEFLTVKLEDETILSVHWADNVHLVACTEDGIITILKVLHKTVIPVANFELPNSKERWLTCAASERVKKLFVFGDRSGGIYIYKKGSKYPLQSLSKLHGRYGPTSITIRDNEMITTGRDKTIKYFKIMRNTVMHTSTKELDFHWVERFLDFHRKIACGFKGTMFVVFDLKANEILLEIECGGGHRSWDVIYACDKKSTHIGLKLTYLKNSNINTESVVLRSPFSVSQGSHSKEINCLKTHQFDERTVFFSGGEDTTLRVSTLDKEMDFEDLEVCKQLSSVRTLKMDTKDCNEVLLIHAGGRAQICIKMFKFLRKYNSIEVKTHDLIDYMLKGTDKARKSESKDLEPETRIMDIDYIKNDERYTIFAGCSDARVRVFIFTTDISFKMINQSEYLPTCILKTVCIHFLRDILITCSTRGDVSFWDATDVEKVDDFKPFFTLRTNKSGINSIVTKELSDNRILIATGGDDNALHINILNIPDQLNMTSIQVQHSLVLDKHHSSAITGLCLVDKYILSTSIDQRITLYDWKVTDKIKCDFVYQTFSDVADIKGMDVITQNGSHISVCVFGKGLEVLNIPTAQN